MPLFAWIPLALTAHAATPAPSFDCTAAASAAEQAVCADPQLAQADQRLALIYAELRRSLPSVQRKPLLTAQRTWLSGRDACAADDACLRPHYQTRITELLAHAPALSAQATSGRATTASALRLFAAMTPEDLNDLAQDRRDFHLAELSCAYFRQAPQDAQRLFGAYFYSHRDGWQPICSRIDVMREVPQTQPLIKSLELAYGSDYPGGCGGSMQVGIARDQFVARIMAVVELAPDFDAAERQRRQRTDGLGYVPGLDHWAQQSPAQRRMAEQIAREAESSRRALQGYYQRRHAMAAGAAQSVARHHVQRLIDVHTGRVGDSSTLFYATACYDTSDLDAYIADGKLPGKACPDGEHLDSSGPALTSRLLVLAVVNGYPTHVVQRLIHAGARLNSPGVGTLETRETLLMLAGGRSDVVDALLKAGADPNAQNDFGKTALMYAVAENDLASVQALIAGGAQVNQATFADRRFHCMLKAGSRSALMYAAWQSTPDIAAALIAAGADRTARDSNGETALNYLGRNTELGDSARAQMRALLERH